MLLDVNSGADPGFQVRGGGGALKKIAPSRGRRENFWGISCEKSRFYTKKIIFLPILGGGGGGGAPAFEAVLGNKEFELVVFGVTFAVVTRSSASGHGVSVLSVGDR